MKLSIPKIQFLFIPLLLICLSSCDNDDDPNAPIEVSYESISRDDIISNENRLSNESIEATNSDGHMLISGDIIIYKTNSNHYGKLKIINIDNDIAMNLTIEAITYKDDGTIFSETENLEIRGTYTGDLDAMLELGGDIPDFHWSRLTITDTNWRPLGSATFTIF